MSMATVQVLNIANSTLLTTPRLTLGFDCRDCPTGSQAVSGAKTATVTMSSCAWKHSYDALFSCGQTAAGQSCADHTALDVNQASKTLAAECTDADCIY